MSQAYNAADPSQVKKAADQTRRLLERQARDMKAVIGTIEGRRLLWRILSHCKTFESIWRPSAEIHHLAGKQDVGHFVMAEITAADESGFLKMMAEAKEYDRV